MHNKVITVKRLLKSKKQINPKKFMSKVKVPETRRKNNFLNVGLSFNIFLSTVNGREKERWIQVNLG